MVIVTQDGNGKFECCQEGETGSPIVGRGASVLEAVGDWSIQSQTVQIKCSPPALLKEFSVGNSYSDIDFKPSPKR